MGRCKSLDSLKFFLRYASSLFRASILFFSILNSPQDTPSGAPAVADGLIANNIFLFTVMAGNSPQCSLLVINSTKVWEVLHNQFVPQHWEFSFLGQMRI